MYAQGSDLESQQQQPKLLIIKINFAHKSRNHNNVVLLGSSLKEREREREI